MTNQELWEAFLDLPKDEREETYKEAIDYLRYNPRFVQASLKDTTNAIKAQIRSMMKEKLSPEGRHGKN